jgi:hypothetical protein
MTHEALDNGDFLSKKTESRTSLGPYVRIFDKEELDLIMTALSARKGESIHLGMIAFIPISEIIYLIRRFGYVQAQQNQAQYHQLMTTSGTAYSTYITCNNNPYLPGAGAQPALIPYTSSGLLPYPTGPMGNSSPTWPTGPTTGPVGLPGHAEDLCIKLITAETMIKFHEVEQMLKEDESEETPEEAHTEAA